MALRGLNSGFLILFLIFFSESPDAKSVEIEHRGLVLLGNLETFAKTKNHSQQIFLLIHGTWAHHQMEIITAIQHALSDTGFSSLAVTLSLGISRRRGFLDCDRVINAHHGHAVDEIAAWVGYLENIGHTNVVLTGHSRGGNQVMLYSARYPESNVRKLILLAPLSMGAKELADQYESEFGHALSQVLTTVENGGSATLNTDVLRCRDVMMSGESFLSYYGDKPVKNTAVLLAEETRPVLLFFGSEDVVATNLPAQQRLFEDNLQIRQVTIEGADHFFRDLYMDEVVEIISSELAQ